ncbi:ABC transporter substrate-binding protein [Paenibacillus hodogayensis]|uniref:ABC transporter substrate-binding protein n=1 Tax=Paenibacillus hodogayensis TaxID=279208 RepID=A0ABV5W0Q6_9BACL
MLYPIRRAGSSAKKHTAIWLSMVLIGSLLTACGANNGNREELPGNPSPAASAGGAVAEKGNAPTLERTVKDELGHEIKLPAAPKRIFAPYLEDSLLKLGMKPVAQWSNGALGHDYLQDELKDVPKLDLSGGLPSPEVLLSYSPDLIILHTATYAANGLYENYSKIAPTYVFNNASGEIEKSLVTLGELLGKSSEADRALKAYEQKVKEAKEKLERATAGKKVAILRFAAKGVSLMGANYFCGYVVHQHLGIAKTKLVEKENSATVSLEVLPQIDADYIFVINAYGQGTERMKEMMGSPIWNGLSAVKQGQVYEVSDKHWLGSGLIAYEKIIDDTVRLIAK